MARQSELPLVEATQRQTGETMPTVRTVQANRVRAGKQRHVGRKWLFRLVAVCLAVAIALFAAEIGLRLLVVQEGKRQAIYDEDLGWRGRPHGGGVYAREADKIRVPFRYNALGFRDNELTPKGRRGKRLLILGDSFVESLEVDFPQTFGAQLERSMQSRDPRWDVSVIGSQGYSTAQELFAFRKYRSVVEPDIVLLCFYCGNDFQDNLRKRFAYLDAEGKLVLTAINDPWWKHQLRRSQRWLYETSHVVYLLKNTVEGLSSINFSPDAKAAAEKGEEYQRDITEKIVVQLKREVAEAGARLGIMIIPARDDLMVGDETKAEGLRRFCDANKIPCLDLSARLALEHFFDVDLHFNVAGHRVVAESVESFVLDPQLAGQELRGPPSAVDQAAWKE